ncbi:MAG: efflux RND transporter permease subunit [Chitinophagales bacterium]|nr:efflux RND transporter permease subunit [Chitinophagales bacterium]
MKNYLQIYKNPVTVIIAIIIMGGVFAYTNMHTALFPEITFPKIKVIADAGKQPVDQMMITVTRPLENTIKQVPDLQDIRSITSRGSCEISAYMDWNANIDLSQQRIESKIAEIKNNLPADVHITVERMNPSILPVIGYTLESSNRSPIELKLLAINTIKPFLSQVSGISEVRIIGGQDKEYKVMLNTQKMSTLGVTPDALSTVFSQTNFVKSNGYLSDYRVLYLTTTNALVDSKEKLENLVVTNSGRRIVTLKDIADVQIGQARQYIKINANGKEGILVAVVKQPGTNLIDLSNEMDQKLNDLRKTLPKDVTIKPYYLQGDFVKDSIKSVRDSLLVGLLLAILVAVIFLRSLKSSVTIFITIPVTLCLSLMILYLMGQTFNIMTLGAIAAAIGLIIDDAIVVVEQIHRTHEEHPEDSGAALVSKALHYLFPAMVGSSLSTIVILLPFMLMSGVAGAYFKVMTNSMTVILICSFFVTWIALPIIYLLLTKKEKKRHTAEVLPEDWEAIKNNILQEKEENISVGHKRPRPVKTQRWVSYFIKRPWISMLICGILLVSIILILPHLQTGFLPEMDEGSIVLDYISPAGTSLEETDRMLREVEKIIVKIPEVQAYSRRTGTQMGFFITEPNNGDYLISLKKNRTRTTDEVIEDIRERVEATQPALQIDFGQVIGDMLGDLMASVQPIEVKVFGTDRTTLQQLSKQIASVVEQVPGTADVFDGIVIAGPSVTITPNASAIAQYGLSALNLQYQLQNSLEGNVVGNVFEHEQLTPVRMLYSSKAGNSLEDINALQIFLPSGKLIPINELAVVTVNAGDAQIERENLESMGVITSRLNNRDLGSVIKDIQKQITSKISLPSGYHIEYGGTYAQQKQSFNELLVILILASLLVFCVILFLFKDLRVALIIISISILGVAGSYLALIITNTPLNVGSYTGLIMIVGIIGENAIFTFWQFRESLKEKSLDDAIIFSISTRLRPKLMTALGAIIALMPIALGIGAGAQLHQPLAIAVIGGFLAGLPLLLIVLPSMIHLILKNYKSTAVFSGPDSGV